MPSALLRLVEDLGEPGVQRASLRGREQLIGDRGEQRVREGEALSILLEDAGSDRGRGRGNVGSDPGLPGLTPSSRKGCVDDSHGRPGQRRRDLRGGAGVRREELEAVAHELLEVGRDGELLGRLERTAARDQGPPDLEREEQIAAGCTPHALERASRKRHPQVAAQQELELAGVEVGERQPLEARARERAIELERCLRASPAPHAEEADPLVLQTPRDERERALGRAVEPLDVVDRQQRGRLLCQRPEHPEQAQSDRALERLLSLRLGAQQRHLQRAPLRGGQTGEGGLGHVGEQIAERRVGQLRLALARPAAQHALPASGGGREPLVPEGRLADADLAFQEQRNRARVDRAEELLHAIELGVAAYERARACGVRQCPSQSERSCYACAAGGNLLRTTARGRSRCARRTPRPARARSGAPRP